MSCGLTCYLEVPCSHVEGKTVATDEMHGLVDANPAAPLPDHHTELDFVVNLLTTEWYLNLLTPSDVRRGRLHCTTFIRYYFTWLSRAEYKPS